MSIFNVPLMQALYSADTVLVDGEPMHNYDELKKNVRVWFGEDYEYQEDRTLRKDLSVGIVDGVAYVPMVGRKGQLQLEFIMHRPMTADDLQEAP